MRDVVQHVRPSSGAGEPPFNPNLRRSGAWFWSAPVLPSFRQVIEQILPNGLMAISAISVLAVGSFAPLGLPIWAIGLFLPTVLLAMVANTQVRPLWRRTALINLATVAVIFPSLVVRQSMLRIPFVEGGNGTLLAPAIATLAVILMLTLLAIACTVLCRDDPEYAGVAFLPSALMVPFLAGVSEVTSLHSALKIVAVVYLASALLTIVASMLPGAFPTLVAPLAIGVEFIILTIVRDSSIFPIGSGSVAKVLFFAVVLLTVTFSILVSIGSAWVRQVNRMATTLRT